MTAPFSASSILAAGPRSEPAGLLGATLAFAWRSVMKVRHVPEQIADVILIPVLFTLMFTYLFGSALAGSTSAYLQFLLPGTLVMAVVTITIYTGVTLNTDLSTGTFDRLRSLPIPAAAPFIGALVGDLGRYLVASTIVIGLGLVMGYRPEGGIVGIAFALIPVLLFSSSLSWAWLALALVLRTPGSVQTFSFVVLFPLTFASNTFVDPGTMPGLVRTLVDVNPVSHLVSLTRGLMAGSVPVAELILVVAGSAIMVAVFAPITAYLYRRRD